MSGMTDVREEAIDLLRSMQSQIGSCRPPAVFDDMDDERAAWDRIDNCIARMRGDGEQGQAVAYWLAVDADGTVHYGLTTDDANGGDAARQQVNDYINETDSTQRIVGVAALSTQPVPSAPKPAPTGYKFATRHDNEPGGVVALYFDTIENADAWVNSWSAPSEQVAACVAVPEWRLLRRGEIIERTDELLTDGCTQWEVVTGFALGMEYDPAAFVPVRRLAAAPVAPVGLTSPSTPATLPANDQMGTRDD